MRITYVASSKAGSTADPRFTIDAKDLPTFGEGKKARPCIEATLEDGRIARIIPPANLYIPGGQNVATVTVNLDVEGVTLAAVATPSASVDATATAPATFDPAVADSLVAIPAMLAGYIASVGLAKKGKAADAMAAAYIAAK